MAKYAPEDLSPEFRQERHDLAEKMTNLIWEARETASHPDLIINCLIYCILIEVALKADVKADLYGQLVWIMDHLKDLVEDLGDNFIALHEEAKERKKITDKGND